MIALLSLPILAQHSHHHHTDRPSVHGMLLVGTEKIYLSHLPMFHSPHDYQVIFEVDLPAEVKSHYQNIKKQNPEQTIFTIVPEVFVLPDMAESPRPFKATIFFGHFERGGNPITKEIIININQVLYFKKFDPTAGHPDSVEYILFGGKEEVFAAHTISAKPDFDHIIEILNTGFVQSILKDEVFAKVLFPSLNKQAPLKANTKYSAVPAKELNDLGVGMIQTKTSIYLEYGDLSF